MFGWLKNQVKQGNLSNVGKHLPKRDENKAAIMKIYGLKNCDTCRKALKALPGAQLIDVRIDGLPEDVLDRALEQFGPALLNTRSTTWRGLDEAQRQRDPRALILQYPALMKRPLVAVDKSLFLFWNSDVETEVKAML
ncbi:MAG: ArsC/Spx/MgsR family protein [Sulfitobacter sp.]